MSYEEKVAKSKDVFKKGTLIIKCLVVTYLLSYVVAVVVGYIYLKRQKIVELLKKSLNFVLNVYRKTREILRISLVKFVDKTRSLGGR
jgi:23S rRNA maturation mini-RNase III